MIAIFGDSHIRSLRYISKDSTFYLGRGRDFRELNLRTIFMLSSRIFILNHFLSSYDNKILSFSEPFFRELKHLSDFDRQEKLDFFFLRFHLLLKILVYLRCKPTHFLLPHSPDFAIHTIVVNSLPHFQSVLNRHSVYPLFVGTSTFNHNGVLDVKYLGFEFTNPSNHDKVHLGSYLGKAISENFKLAPNVASFSSLTNDCSYPLQFSAFKFFFKWNSLFACYRYQTMLIKLTRLKSCFLESFK